MAPSWPPHVFMPRPYCPRPLHWPLRGCWPVTRSTAWRPTCSKPSANLPTLKLHKDSDATTTDYRDKNSHVRPHCPGRLWFVHGHVRGGLGQDALDQWCDLFDSLDDFFGVDCPDLGVHHRLQEKQLFR